MISSKICLGICSNLGVEGHKFCLCAKEDQILGGVVMH